MYNYYSLADFSRKKGSKDKQKRKNRGLILASSALLGGGVGYSTNTPLQQKTRQTINNIKGVASIGDNLKDARFTRKYNRTLKVTPRKLKKQWEAGIKYLKEAERTGLDPEGKYLQIRRVVDPLRSKQLGRARLGVAVGLGAGLLANSLLNKDKKNNRKK